MKNRKFFDVAEKPRGIWISQQNFEEKRSKKLKIKEHYVSSFEDGFLERKSDLLLRTSKLEKIRDPSYLSEPIMQRIHRWLNTTIDNPFTMQNYGSDNLIWELLFERVKSMDVDCTVGYSKEIYEILYGEKLDPHTIYHHETNKLEKKYKKDVEALKLKSEKIDNRLSILIKKLWDKYGILECLKNKRSIKIEMMRDRNDEALSNLWNQLIENKYKECSKLLEECDESLFNEQYPITNENKKILIDIYKKNGVKV